MESSRGRTGNVSLPRRSKSTRGQDFFRYSTVESKVERTKSHSARILRAGYTRRGQSTPLRSRYVDVTIRFYYISSSSELSSPDLEFMFPGNWKLINLSWRRIRFVQSFMYVYIWFPEERKLSRIFQVKVNRVWAELIKDSSNETGRC